MLNRIENLQKKRAILEKASSGILGDVEITSNLSQVLAYAALLFLTRK
jgi:hypothetical protein